MIILPVVILLFYQSPTLSSAEWEQIDIPEGKTALLINNWTANLTGMQIEINVSNKVFFSRNNWTDSNRISIMFPPNADIYINDYDNAFTYSWVYKVSPYRNISWDGERLIGPFANTTHITNVSLISNDDFDYSIYNENMSKLYNGTGNFSVEVIIPIWIYMNCACQWNISSTITSEISEIPPPEEIVQPEDYTTTIFNDNTSALPDYTTGQQFNLPEGTFEIIGITSGGGVIGLILKKIKK